MRAIDLKRLAPDIQDSITAENIGALPDVTITDSLQRVTGVQINRDAGVGTSVDVRGLPQVGTMLNGEVFITADQIDSQQPDFSMLPSTLFHGVDVVKSSTANETDGGISGAIDLHTYRPWDLPSGFTYSYSANGERGSTTDRWGPEANGLVSYNDDGKWGLLVSADFSNTTRENSTEGLDQYGVVLNGENAASAGGYNGFLTPRPFRRRSTRTPTAAWTSTATASPTGCSWAARTSASTTPSPSASASPAMPRSRRTSATASA
jgi:TonB-dependent receptor